MNNKKQYKYESRKNKRNLKRQLDNIDYDNFEKVFSYDNLLKAALLCKRNVNWKASVQNYMREMHFNVYATYHELMERKFKIKSTFEFDTYERGKKRHIRSVHIRERVVQRCLCDNCLIPILSKTFIYDNGASMKGKGVDFALKRVITHLQKHYRKYGNSGYVLIFDFSDYFGSISHEIIFNMVKNYIHDEDLLWLIKIFIDMYDGDVGLGLGSQTSQVFSLLAASPIDHLIKDKLGIKGYVRYMDDGIIFHPDKSYLEKILIDIQEKSEQLGLKLNIKKTKILKIKNGFTFLKKRIRIDENGKINIRISRTSITRMRRKLKKFRVLYEEGKMSYEDIYTAYQSWKSFCKKCDAYNTLKNMDNLFNSLFIKPFVDGRDYFVFQNYRESECSGCFIGNSLCEIPKKESSYTSLQ